MAFGFAEQNGDLSNATNKLQMPNERMDKQNLADIFSHLTEKEWSVYCQKVGV